MFAKLPASVPRCIGNSGSSDTWNCGTVPVAVVVAGICGTCPTGVPPPPPTLWNRGVVVVVLPPPRLLPLNGLTPLISELGVMSLPLRPPVTKLLI